MTSGPTNGDDLRWLLNPPAPGEVHIHLAVGEGTELTPAVQEALERLVDALYGQEVEGYLFAATASPKCPDLRSCGTYSCESLHNCVPLHKGPCAALVTCVICSPVVRPLP